MKTLLNELYLCLGIGDKLIYALVAFVLIDIITTTLSSIITRKKISCFILLAQKLVEFLLSYMGYIIDICIVNSCDMTFRRCIILFYIGYEGLVILLNASNLGLPIPTKLKFFLEKLLHKGDESSKS